MYNNDTQAQRPKRQPGKKFTGTVKWFNKTKGYGFIVPDEGGDDIFVHIKAVQKARMDSLSDGQRLEYELVEANGRTTAGYLRSAA